MTPQQFDQFWIEHKPGLVALINSLKSDITDDCSSCGDDQDTEPNIGITISVNEDCTTWSYQTGDNSFTGSCYDDPYWGISAIYRDSKAKEVATELIDSLGEAIDFE